MCYNKYVNEREKGIDTMMATLDMTKPWHEQSAQARAMIKEEDFYKVARMLGYKIKIEKRG